jgi:ubiquinone/menaquinone biosynthesis C-methylase UbiE
MGRRVDQHRELLDWIGARSGSRWCEVGFGPGQFVEQVCGRGAGDVVVGVDPSPVMLAQARRRNAAPVEAGRVDLRVGVAEDLPFPDRSVDYVVAVNSVAVWPDLDGGLAEARRVLVPGGRLVVAWHGAASPNRIQRQLARTQAWWTGTERRIDAVFANATRCDLTYSTVCTADRLAD